MKLTTSINSPSPQSSQSPQPNANTSKVPRERRNMKGVVAAILLAIAVSCLVAKPGHALTCVDVNLCLTPCIAYLTGQQATPTPACCQGVTKLKALADTTSDRQLACNCMKQAASHFQNIDDDAVTNLPKKCGTPLPFPVNKEVDCSKIP